jgi:hypothetical protein
MALESTDRIAFANREKRMPGQSPDILHVGVASERL